MNSFYLDFLYNLGLFNIKLGLSTIREMLHRMGDPHQHPRIVHFAGTNGKGSTLATLERLLLDSEFTIGATISPHLLSFNERFRINGQNVDDKQLDDAFEAVCRSCNIDLNLNKPESRDGKIRPTFFEFSIAIAFELFRRFKVDYILLETGLGGRLDATNVIEHPLACVLTRIDFDHQEYLGNTLNEITREKLGILKNGSPVFVSWQQKAVSQQIVDFCLESGIELYQASVDFDSQRNHQAQTTDYFLKFGNTEIAINGVRFQSLLGEHQKQNTATALAVYHFVVSPERQLPIDRILKSLQNVVWRGRLEFLDQCKTVLLDGAHNESAFLCLLDYLRKFHSSQKILIAIGWKQDKHFVDTIDLEGLNQVEFIPVSMQSKSALNAEQAFHLLLKRQFKTYSPIDVKTLVIGIKNKSLPDYELLVITGSLYLLGEFLLEW